MSDDQDAIYIGPDKDDLYPEIIEINSSKQNFKGEYKVQIKEFEIVKQSYIMATETQIYKVSILLNNNHITTIHRRFSDFEFLFDIIQERYPGLMIPGFQQKTLLSYFQAKISSFKKPFIEMRMQFLTRFLTKILNIDALKGSKQIQNFLSVEEQFQIFKKANIGDIKKKGIIGNLISTAGNFFKSKKVDSKYEKILESAVSLFKQLQKVKIQFLKYPNSISSEADLTSSLKQTNPQIFGLQLISKKFEFEAQLAKQQVNQMLYIIDELMYCELDLKFFMYTIERRYQLKQNGDYKMVDRLQKTFEAQKDGFLEYIRVQMEKVKSDMKKQVIQYRNKLSNIWSS